MRQDVVGTLDRINTPSTVGAHNWTWRLPATIANTLSDGALRPALDRARAAAERAGR
jgi:4-alpha-glucanotransferase